MSFSGAAVTPVSAPRRAMITLTLMLATIIYALDMTIANVALPHMQGSFSTTQDQISWVITSYIVATAITTLVVGRLAELMGRRRLQLLAVAGFALTSVLCGLTETLPQMVAARILQGVFGAPLIPLSQAILLDINPRHKHGSAMAIWGMGVMLGPILGPTLGGYLTDLYHWRLIFLINVPVCAVALLGAYAFVPEAEATSKRHFDWLGFASLALVIGTLQTMLDRGERLDWLESPEVLIELAIIAAALWVFFVHSASTRHPYISPLIRRDKNFALGICFALIIGVVLVATMILLPPFMQQLRGFPVLTAGLVLSPRGLGTMLAMVVVGRLVDRFDPRLLIASGFLMIAYSGWDMAGFNLEVAVADLVRTGFVQGVGLGFVFVPLSTITFATLEPRFRTEAAGFFSLCRNLGSSIGVSIVITVLTRSLRINQAELAEHLTPFAAAARLPGSPAALEGLPALALWQHEVGRQAAMIAYNNDFLLLAFGALGVVPLCFLLRRPHPLPA